MQVLARYVLMLKIIFKKIENVINERKLLPREKMTNYSR